MNLFQIVLKQSFCLFNVKGLGMLYNSFKVFEFFPLFVNMTERKGMLFFDQKRKANIFLFRFALQHGGRILLADEMGLGKTLQVVAKTMSKMLVYSHLPAT